MHLASLNKFHLVLVALRRIMIGPDLLERVVVPHIPPPFFFSSRNSTLEDAIPLVLGVLASDERHVHEADMNKPSSQLLVT